MLQLHVKNLELLDEEKTYLEEKANEILHISKNAEQNEAVSIRFDVEKENGKEKDHQFFCSISLSIPGKMLHAQTHGTGVYAVIDDAAEKITIQMKKEKEKHIHL